MNFLNTHIPNPVAFEVFGLSIMWYGILIGIGILLASTVAYQRAPKHEIPRDRLLDVFIVCLIAGVIGSRVYYVVFNWSQYSGDFMMMINLRLGGLSIHGGLIFGFLAGFIVCRLWNIRPLNMFDLVVPGIALAQAVGRWGNYFNSEAHGGPTELPWGIPIGGQMMHPTFLYESIWCLMLFVVLILIDNRRVFEGQTFLCYGALYSFGRFFIEILRTDSLMIGMLKQAQVLSVIVFIVCIIFYIKLKKSEESKGRIFF